MIFDLEIWDLVSRQVAHFPKAHALQFPCHPSTFFVPTACNSYSVVAVLPKQVSPID